MDYKKTSLESITSDMSVFDKLLSVHSVMCNSTHIWKKYMYVIQNVQNMKKNRSRKHHVGHGCHRWAALVLESRGGRRNFRKTRGCSHCARFRCWHVSFFFGNNYCRLHSRKASKLSCVMSELAWMSACTHVSA